MQLQSSFEVTNLPPGTFKVSYYLRCSLLIVCHGFLVAGKKAFDLSRSLRVLTQACIKYLRTEAFHFFLIC